MFTGQHQQQQQQHPQTTAMICRTRPERANDWMNEYSTDSHLVCNEIFEFLQELVYLSTIGSGGFRTSIEYMRVWPGHYELLCLFTGNKQNIDPHELRYRMVSVQHGPAVIGQAVIGYNLANDRESTEAEHLLIASRRKYINYDVAQCEQCKHPRQYRYTHLPYD